jgi:hypothetical protein
MIGLPTEASLRAGVPRAGPFPFAARPPNARHGPSLNPKACPGLPLEQLSLQTKDDGEKNDPHGPGNYPSATRRHHPSAPIRATRLSRKAADGAVHRVPGPGLDIVHLLSFAAWSRSILSHWTLRSGRRAAAFAPGRGLSLLPPSAPTAPSGSFLFSPPDQGFWFLRPR